MVRIMAIYHHAITRGVTMPQRGIARHISIHYHAIIWGVTIPSHGVTFHMAIDHHATTWGVTTSPRGIARRSYLFLALLGGKLDVAGVVFQNLLAQGCRVDVRVNLCG